MTTQHKDQDCLPQSISKQHNKPCTEAEVGTQKTTRRYIRGSHPARVTRISVESSDEGGEKFSKPRIKQGVRISKASSDESTSVIVASALIAISINYPGARAILSKLDGEHTASDISSKIDVSLQNVESVIKQLEMAQLLDMKNSKLKLHNRFQSPIAERAANTEDQSNDASFKQLQTRMKSELALATWISGVIDGGVELLSSRQNFGVEIYGENRLATMIYTALLASGVTNTKFSITTSRDESFIGDRDLGTGMLRISDFGLNFRTRTEELSREWSLFPTASKNVKGTVSSPIPERNLRVIVGEHPEKLTDQLMRDGLDHLFVGQTLGGATTLGPLVFPRVSPCSNCLSLSKRDQHGVGELVANNLEGVEIPIAPSFHIAGLAVQAILQLIDTGKTDLLGAQICCDYTTPIPQQLMKIARHPLCGCQWGSQEISLKSTGNQQHFSALKYAETILF